MMQSGTTLRSFTEKMRKRAFPKRRNSDIPDPPRGLESQPGASGITQSGSVSNITEPINEEPNVSPAKDLIHEPRNQSPPRVPHDETEVDTPTEQPEPPMEQTEPPTRQPQSIKSPLPHTPVLEPSLDWAEPSPASSKTEDEQLWDMAYKRMKTSYPEMAIWYERILSHEIDNDTSYQLLPTLESSTGFMNTINQTDPRARQWQMYQLIATLSERPAQEQDSDVHTDYDNLKDVLRETAQRSPEASLAWVPVSLFPKILLGQRSGENDKSCSDFIDIISRLEWFCSLPKLLDGETKDDESTIAQRQERVRERLVDLYTTILAFEVKFTCNNLGHLDPHFDGDILDPSITVAKINEAERVLSYGVELKAQFDRILEDTDTGQDSSVGSSEKELAESDTQIKDDLHVVDREHGMQYTGFKDSKSMKDLYQWFLTMEEYRGFLDWDIPGHNPLWVGGGPGRGKTMVLSEIVRHLSAPTFRTAENWFTAYFFCGQSMLESDSPAKVLKGLIKLLLDQQPSLISHLKDMRASTGRQYFDDPNDFFALSMVFYSMLRDDNFVKTYFVIDAIDECFNGEGTSAHEDLIQLISMSISSSSKTRWLVSSRNRSDIRAGFETLRSWVHITIDADPLDRPLSATVDAYIDYKVSSLAEEKGYSESLRIQIYNLMQERPQRNFLWVDIVCTALQKEDNWYALTVLHEMPDGLDDLCDDMRIRIEKLPRQDSVFCKEILTNMAIALEPLCVQEVPALLKLEHDGGLVDVDSLVIVEKCSAFLEIRNNSVGFRHQSLKDYVRHHMLEGIAASRAHAKLALRSLKSLSRFFGKTSTDARTLSAPTRISRSDPMESIKYASFFWIWHMCQVEEKVTLSGAIAAAIRFFKEHFLHWVKILESRRHEARATTLLFGFERHVRTQLGGDSEAASIIRDVHRLLQFHQSFQADCPEEFRLLYTMLFCPVKSVLGEIMTPWLATTTARHASQELQVLSGHHDWVRCVDFSPDGNLVASGSDDNSIRVWDVRSGTVQHTLEEETSWIYSLAISKKHILASGSDEGVVKLWNLNTGFMVKEFTPLPGAVTSINFSHDGSQLVAAIRKSVYIWNLGNGDNKPIVLENSEDYVRTVVFSSDGSKLLSAGDDKVINVWDTKARTVLYTLQEHNDIINSAVFSPDMNYIASASDDKTVMIWDAENGTLLKTLSHGNVSFSSVAFSPNGSRLAFAADEFVGTWDSKSWKLNRVFRGHTSFVRAVTFSPQGDLLASVSNDGTIRFWDEETGGPAPADETMLQPRPESAISVIAFSANGSRFASCSSEGLLQLWDGHTGQPLGGPTVTDHERQVTSLMFSPDGNAIVTASTDETVRIFRTSDGKLEHFFDEHTDWVRFATFSPDGEYLASASDDQKVRVWNLKTSAAERLQELEGHNGYVRCLAFSPDGCYLASGGDDTTVRVWRKDSSSWINICALKGHSRIISDVAFYPDSSRILSSSHDKTLKIWDLQTREQQQSIDTDQPYHRLWFDDRSIEYVMTEYGAKPISTSSLSQPPAWAPYGVLYDDENYQYWITFNNQKLIFIGDAHKPECFCIHGRKVVLGCESGQVLLFNFSTGVNPPLKSIGSE